MDFPLLTNFGLDGIGNTSTNSEGTDKLHYRRDTHSLRHGKGAGRNRSSKRVGNIVGTDIPGILSNPISNSFLTNSNPLNPKGSGGKLTKKAKIMPKAKM